MRGVTVQFVVCSCQSLALDSRESLDANVKWAMSLRHLHDTQAPLLLLLLPYI